MNGKNGFVIDGANQGGGTGYVTRAGDVNGDGVNDILIADYSGAQDYVVFGYKANNTFSAEFNLASVNGTNGFNIMKISGDETQAVQAIGDINGDHVDDIIIGKYQVNNYAGQNYVIYGTKYGFPA